MPRRKKYAVWLSETAVRDACEATQEYVTVLHDRARKSEREWRGSARQEADRMAASAKELHDALEGIYNTRRGNGDK